MQTTSATWKALAATGAATLLSKAIIGGVEYTEITAPIINRGLMQEGLSIGNCVSATCNFTVRTTNAIARAAEVQIKMALTDGTTTSEWLPVGTFYVAHREVDPISGLVSLECYDALLKANASYEYGFAWTTHNSDLITNANGEVLFLIKNSMTMVQVVNEIAALLGLTLDSRTAIQTGSAFKITQEANGAAIRDVLGGIAAAHGGNWIVTPDNKLRLVPINSAANASSATGDVVDIIGITGGISLCPANTITGIRITSKEGVERLIGEDSGIVVEYTEVDGVGYSDTYLNSVLIGKTYQSYSLSSAIYDPAVELGDYVNSNDDVHSILVSENVRLGAAFRGDIQAPEAGEISDEYPYISPRLRQAQLQKLYTDKVSQQVLESANVAVAQAAQRAAQDVQNLDNSLTQREIFDRLTDGGLEQGIALEAPIPNAVGANGEKKIFLNMDYARFGKLIADFIQGGTLALGGFDNYKGILNILDEDGNIIGAWNNNGITVSKGVIAGPSVTLGGEDNAKGVLTILDGEGASIGVWNNNGITISKGSISGTNGNYWDLSNTGQIVAKTGVIGDFTLSGGTLNASGTNYACSFGATGLQYEGYDSGLQMTVKTILSGEGLYFYDKTGSNFVQDGRILSLNDGLALQGGASPSGSLIVAYNEVFSGLPLSVLGNFSASGTKSRRVETDQYSDRLLYCYETPSPLFGDVGEGVISDDGKCYVWLDPIFAQTISTEQYQVFLQAYGDGKCWIAERHPAYFVVEGDVGLAFGWELKAKQKDFDQKRLEKTGQANAPQQINYGAYAAQHIENIQKARVSA